MTTNLARLCATTFAAFLVIASVTQVVPSAQAQSTSGKKKSGSGLSGTAGDVKIKVMFPEGTSGGCQTLYKRYIAANGHSAYAATAIDYYYGGNFACGIAMNSSSQAEAERRAIADCQLAIKQAKARAQETGFLGSCRIHASK